MCADNRNGECPMHGPLHSLRRLVGTSSSAAPVTLPDVPDWLRDLPREVRLSVCLSLSLSAYVTDCMARILITVCFRGGFVKYGAEISFEQKSTLKSYKSFCFNK